MSHPYLETHVPDNVLAPQPFAALAGNPADDDGEALDDQFVPNPDKALPFNGIASESREYEAESIPVITRILSRAITIGMMSDGVTIADPVQVFPADAQRKELHVQTSANVAIGSDKSDVYNNAYLAPNTLFTSTEHTGAVWIAAPTASGPVIVTVWVVTE